MLVENKIVMKRISEIRPYARNPRRNAKTVELLCELIPQVGFNVPLVIDEKGVIVKGHARFSAAIRLGMKEVPCIITHADEDAVKADRITDNKIAEFSEWMNEEVLDEIESIDSNIDFGKMGFPVVSFADIPTQEEQLNDGIFIPTGNEHVSDCPEEPVKIREKYYKCVCNKCGNVMFIKASTVN